MSADAPGPEHPAYYEWVDAPERVAPPPPAPPPPATAWPPVGPPPPAAAPFPSPPLSPPLPPAPPFPPPPAAPPASAADDYARADPVLPRGEILPLIAAKWRRVVASQIDLFSLLLLPVVPFLVLRQIGVLGKSPDLGLAYGLLVLVNVWLLHPKGLSRRGARNGQTLGMQLMKVRIVRIDGLPVAYRSRSANETLGVLYAGLSLRLYRLIDDDWGLLLAPRKQEWFDRTGPTFAVRAEVRQLPAHLLLPPAPRAGTPPR